MNNENINPNKPQSAGQPGRALGGRQKPPSIITNRPGSPEKRRLASGEVSPSKRPAGLSATLEMKGVPAGAAVSAETAEESLLSPAPTESLSELSLAIPASSTVLVDNYKDYYYGLEGKILLARNKSLPWSQQLREGRGFPYPGPPVPAEKFVFAAHSLHPLNKALEDGLRASTNEILSKFPTTCTIFCHIGYDTLRAEAPLVFWIVVEPGKVSQSVAKIVVDKIYDKCCEYKVPMVDVEMTEGITNLSASPGIASHSAPVAEYPLVGSSLSLDSKYDGIIPGGNGTLGAYIQVDGKPYALTNHHVALNATIEEPYPSEAINRLLNRGDPMMVQPGDSDYGQMCEYLERQLESLQKRHAKSKNPKITGPAVDSKKAELDEALNWKDRESRYLGVLSRSSGVPGFEESTEGKLEIHEWFRKDWAIIELGRLTHSKEGKTIAAGRGHDLSKFINELPPHDSFAVSNKFALQHAMIAGGEAQVGKVFKNTVSHPIDVKDLKTEDHLPTHLKRALTFKEFQTLAANKDNDVSNGQQNLLLLKTGRVTGTTTGLANGIKSDYFWTDPKSSSGKKLYGMTAVIIDVPAMNKKINQGEEYELVENDTGVSTRPPPFSKKGDSGSVVWTIDGFVAGLFWGGIDGTTTNFMIPIEFVLEDIKQACGAKTVEMVVRPEDVVADDTLFQTRRRSQFHLNTSTDDSAMDWLS